MLAFGLIVLLGTAFSSFFSWRWMLIGGTITEITVAVAVCATDYDLLARIGAIALAWLAYQIGVGLMIVGQLLRPDPAATST